MTVALVEYTFEKTSSRCCHKVLAFFKYLPGCFVAGSGRNFDFLVSNPTGGVYMTVQHSFSKIEKELLPAFRQQIGAAESTEDVRNFFAHTILELLSRATEGEINAVFEDIKLNHNPDSDECGKYNLGEAITSKEAFKELWNTSDLQHIIDRFAYSACNRYKHLEKKPEKTEAKIRM